jgi:hypothetical protein
MSRKKPSLDEVSQSVLKNGKHTKSDSGQRKKTIDPEPPPPKSIPIKPIPLGAAPPAPAFPLDVLPDPLRKLVEEGAWAFNCPSDFFGVYLLGLASGAIANSRHLSITRTHSQAPCLYLAVVGPPGSGKSPALKTLRRPFDLAEQRNRRIWEEEMASWKKADEEDRGQRPILQRVLVSDITTESLGLVLSENPRGLVMVRDELMGLIAGMNQYKGGKGSDRQVYLALWSGDTISIDRKSDRSQEGAPLYVADPFTSIVGGIQPTILERLRGDAARGQLAPDDGFLDRFLIVHPECPPAIGEDWRAISEPSLQIWDDVVTRLFSQHMVTNEQGEKRPYFVQLNMNGRDAWKKFTTEHAAEQNAEDFPAFLVGPWAKLKGYGARLALVIHELRRACQEVAKRAPGFRLLQEVGTEVDGWSMNCAAELVAYFKGHIRKVYALMDADPQIGDARRVLACLARHKTLNQFTRRDVFQYLRRYFKRPEALDAPFRLLVEHQYLITMDDESQGKPGRKAERYLVNQLWDRTLPQHTYTKSTSYTELPPEDDPAG